MAGKQRWRRGRVTQLIRLDGPMPVMVSPSAPNSIYDLPPEERKRILRLARRGIRSMLRRN